MTNDVWAMWAAALVALAMVARAWPLRREPAVMAFLWTMASAGAWAVVVAAELPSRNWGFKLLLVQAKPFALMSLSTGFILIAARRRAFTPWLGWRWGVLLAVVPAVTMALTLTGSEFYRTNYRLRPHGPLMAMSWDGGPWQTVVHGYIYLTSLGAIGAFLRRIREERQEVQWSILLTLGAWTLVFAADLVSKLALVSMEWNLTAYALLSALLLTGWSARNRLILRPGPVGRNQIVEGMKDLWFVLGGDGRLLDCNRVAARAVGFEDDSWLGVEQTQLRAEWREALEAAPGTRVALQAEGAGRVYSVETTVLGQVGARPLGRLVVLHDITELDRLKQELDEKLAELAASNRNLREEIERREEAERRLVEAARLEAVGRLAGGVAHDFNNLLTVVTGYSELLEAELAGETAAGRQVREIRRAGERAAALTRQLLAFSRQQMIQPETIDLQQLLWESQAELASILGEGIRLRCGLSREPLPLLADPQPLKESLRALARNARDAMPEGGEWVVTTERVKLEKGAVEGWQEMGAGEYALVTLSDTGRGMTEETRTRLFEPFFTTKRTASGAGLGLAVVYGVVKQLGGHISVQSEPGRGAKFEVHLPLREREQTVKGEAGPREAGRSAPRVLLVEDEVEVRRLAELVLEGAGFEVVAAADAEEAVERGAGRIDVLVTDVVLPGMAGTELARRLRQARPELRVILTSGYAREERPQQRGDEGESSFLQKPFTPAQLTALVKQVSGWAGR